MSFSRLFGILFLATAFLTGTSFAAKNNSGKVRYTVGDASLQKKGKGDWAPVRMGNKVAQNDNIRTLLEAQVIISLPDGSSLTINENTFVAMSELRSEDGINRTTVDIKNGKVDGYRVLVKYMSAWYTSDNEVSTGRRRQMWK